MCRERGRRCQCPQRILGVEKSDRAVRASPFTATPSIGTYGASAVLLALMACMAIEERAKTLAPVPAAALA